MISYDMPFSEYAAIDAANASKLKVLYKDEPARLDEEISDQKKRDAALRFGTISHIALLEPERISTDTRVLPQLDMRTKAGRYQRDLIHESTGGQWLYYEEAEAVKEMGSALRRNKNSDIGFILSCIDDGSCKTEFSIHSPGFFNGLGGKVRVDYGLVGNGYMGDYKTCQSAVPKEFVKNAINLGYDLAAAFYCDVYEEATGEKIDNFSFIAQEKKYPFLSSLIEFDCDGKFMSIGREKYLEAQSRYEDYKEGRKGYNGNSINGDLILPAWYK